MESKTSSSATTTQSQLNISTPQEESHISRIAKHPLVSALLWFCGSNVESKDGIVKSSSGRILWSNKSNSVLAADNGREGEGESKSGEISDFEIAQSPQWGFYVAITPPVDDAYIKTVKLPKPSQS